MELLFADETNLPARLGRMFKLFEWTGVAPTDTFQVVSPYRWNLSNLYTTSEVTLAAVPEPATFLLLVTKAAGWCLRRGRLT
jgi:hypothetical protein